MKTLQDLLNAEGSHSLFGTWSQMSSPDVLEMLGSAGFDFTGVYTDVVEHERIAYTMDGEDARKAVVEFIPVDDGTNVKVTFDMEHTNPAEMQKAGWQSILDNFKDHVESE